MQQVAVGGVKLNAVETCLDGVRGGGDNFLDNSRELVGAEFARYRVSLLAVGRANFTFDGDGAGANDLVATGDIGVRNAPAVHDLGKDAAARSVNSVGDLLPACDLLLRDEPRLSRV
ncbi:hypothetical protein D3C73_1344800 [compost metagenome]